MIESFSSKVDNKLTLCKQNTVYKKKTEQKHLTLSIEGFYQPDVVLQCTYECKSKN